MGSVAEDLDNEEKVSMLDSGLAFMFFTVADRVISRSASQFTAKRFDLHCSPFTVHR